MQKQKRVVTIQDISCFGKCSLTVALPILSAIGLECAIIPTAVLSTHTGGFKGWTFRDLTDDIPEVSAHWKAEGLVFDGLYTGYLGSPRQASMICDFIETFRPGFTFVDPAMADNGKLYAGFTDEIVPAMAKLCAMADMVVPNITEASLITGIPYRAPGEYDEAYIKSQLQALVKLGAKQAAITGVRYIGSDKQGIVSLDGAAGTYVEYYTENLPVSCHGTGDVYASTMFGAMIRGKSVAESLKLAADNTVRCIRATMGDESHWYGVRFEDCIPALIRDLGL
ncbi:MAG: pyridoxamine kinase [Ruminococcaceae bacterium]|nr:pyridoxamine kinase [Oscillospiraceae bacterium]